MNFFLQKEIQLNILLQEKKASKSLGIDRLVPLSGPLIVSERQKLVDNKSYVVVVLLQKLLIELTITEAHLHQAFLTGAGRTTRRPGH